MRLDRDESWSWGIGPGAGGFVRLNRVTVGRLTGGGRSGARVLSPGLPEGMLNLLGRLGWWQTAGRTRYRGPAEVHVSLRTPQVELVPCRRRQIASAWSIPPR